MPGECRWLPRSGRTWRSCDELGGALMRLSTPARLVALRKPEASIETAGALYRRRARRELVFTPVSGSRSAIKQQRGTTSSRVEHALDVLSSQNVAAAASSSHTAHTSPVAERRATGQGVAPRRGRGSSRRSRRGQQQARARAASVSRSPAGISVAVFVQRLHHRARRRRRQARAPRPRCRDILSTKSFRAGLIKQCVQQQIMQAQLVDVSAYAGVEPADGVLHCSRSPPAPIPRLPERGRIWLEQRACPVELARGDHASRSARDAHERLRSQPCPLLHDAPLRALSAAIWPPLPPPRSGFLDRPLPASRPALRRSR